MEWASDEIDLWPWIEMFALLFLTFGSCLGPPRHVLKSESPKVLLPWVFHSSLIQLGERVGKALKPWLGSEGCADGLPHQRGEFSVGTNASLRQP